jgi:hypothetical protein
MQLPSAAGTLFNTGGPGSDTQQLGELGQTSEVCDSTGPQGASAATNLWVRQSSTMGSSVTGSRLRFDLKSKLKAAVSASQLLRSSMDSGALQNNSSTAVAGGRANDDAVLPIMLPGKLQWVRDTYRRKGLPPSKSLQNLNVRNLHSELFFGKYTEDTLDSHAPGFQGVRTGLLGQDGIQSFYTPERLAGLENKQKTWGNSMSFDRIAKYHHGY